MKRKQENICGVSTPSRLAQSKKGSFYTTTETTKFPNGSLIGLTIEKVRPEMVAANDNQQGVKLDFLYLERFGDMEVIRSWLPPLSWGNSLISHGSALFMMFGGVLPYVPQYREILRTKNADGFSTFVCLALLVANILRIFFWFCVRFETPLLIQSIIMTTAMLLMIHLCIRTRREQLITPPPKTKTFHDLEWRHFWQWTDFLSYVECTIIFTIIAGSVVFLFKDVTVVVEFVGLVAVLTEALLGMPQFYKNFVNKSTAGMSTSMVMLWLFGDVFKTAYFVLRDSPVQFVLCGILQVRSYSLCTEKKTSTN
ncbi:PQ-loop repeat-containing protein 1-like isoform X2 [Varroa destructor]|uniref:PQ-loop repeat-containing protein 1 n=1 Tax=Varroa destructor TaxID=109461 RepID=A0A7M7KV17_VARDE|nr:PQ-loop repeat-containing protein 1-like isoform X2 [Varroa destructor]